MDKQCIAMQIMTALLSNHARIVQFIVLPLIFLLKNIVLFHSTIHCARSQNKNVEFLVNISCIFFHHACKFSSKCMVSFTSARFFLVELHII